MPFAIQTKNLTKTYGTIKAVDKLNLEIEEGELFALLGVNGAGKTTTIKMLSTLALPDEGEAFVCGKNVITEADEVKKAIGISPQETAVAPLLSTRENLILMCRIHGMKKAEAEKKANELISLLSLSSIEKRRAGKLSGGWQRRLSIALSLAAEPKVLFLDEPTLGLDVIARSELWDVIRGLKGKATIILTTHYMEEAERLSDRVGVMKSGKLLFTGSKDEMLASTKETSFQDAFIALVKEEKK